MVVQEFYSRPTTVAGGARRERYVKRRPQSDEQLRAEPSKESTPKMVRCSSEGGRPGTAPSMTGSRRNSRSSAVLISRSENDAMYKLSHLKRQPAYTMHSCPKRNSLSMSRTSWYPNSCSDAPTTAGPADADLSRITSKV